MLSSVNLTPTAKAELNHQVSYLHLHGSARIAERFVDAVQKSFEQLAKMPELGSEVPVRRVLLSGMRCWPMKKPFQKYVIYYRMTADSIDIIHLLHSARDSDTLLNG